MAEGEVNYRLKADASGFTSEVAKAERSVSGLDKQQQAAGKSAKGIGDSSSGIDKLRKSFSGLGAVVAGLGIGAAFAKMVKETSAQDAAMAQLNATLKSTQFAAGKTAEELAKTAQGLQSITTYGDDAIIGMQSLLLTFKNVKGDNFDRTTKAILDMSTAMGTDLKSSALQVGKALNDPIKGLGALSRAGVQFTADQKDLIKSMVEAGRAADAQKLILKELESQFGGSAEAARNTLGGALKALENSFGDLFEAEQSASSGMVAGINEMNKAISNPAIKDGINLIIEAMLKLFTVIRKVFEGWNLLGRALADGFAKLREWDPTGILADDLDRMGLELTATVTPVNRLSEVVVNATRKTTEFAESVQSVNVAVEKKRHSVDELQEIVVTATKKETQYNAAIAETATVTEEATQAQGPFQDALQGTIERIDEAFANAWKGGFDSFSDFADGLKEAFKQLLGELAHLAITRPIVMSIGATLGLPGAANAAGAGGSILSGGSSLLSGGSSIMSLLSGGASSALGSLGNLYTQAGNFFGAGTTVGNSALAIGRNYSYGSVGSGLANVGLNFGAGLLGNYAGNAVFGDTTGIGSGVGALAGSLFGPVGTGVGAFLGSGAERLLGNVFGFGGNGGNNAGRSTFNLATGQINTAGIGQNFDQANVDAAGGLTAVLQQFANTIGGSNFSGAVKVGNRSGITMGGVNYKSPEEFFQATFDAIIDGATNLAEPLKVLIRGFDGTAEQMMTFAGAVISLSDQAGINSVTQAIEDFNRVQPTMMEAYRDQSSELETLITNFDGSAYAADELATALATNKIAAYEFAMAIQAIGEQLGKTASDQAQAIRESVMTEEELRNARNFERAVLEQTLPTLTNPEEVAEVTNRILELNRQLFDTLPEELRAERAEAFAEYAQWTGDVAQQVLDKSISEMQSTQERINAQVSQMLNDTAARQQAAANTMQSAANGFASVVNSLQTNGIRVNVSNGREVNV